MISSEIKSIDLGVGIETFRLPIYSDISTVYITSMPTWVECNYSVGDAIPIVSNKAILIITNKTGYIV